MADFAVVSGHNAEYRCSCIRVPVTRRRFRLGIARHPDLNRGGSGLWAAGIPTRCVAPPVDTADDRLSLLEGDPAAYSAWVDPNDADRGPGEKIFFFRGAPRESDCLVAKYNMSNAALCLKAVCPRSASNSSSALPANIRNL